MREYFAGRSVLTQVGKGSTIVSLPGPVNVTKLIRACSSPGGGFATRCTLERNSSLVQACIRSPALMVKAPGTGGQSAQDPSGIRTCKPPSGGRIPDFAVWGPLVLWSCQRRVKPV
eukprot:Skav207849  [mRNA]  locus=scaffold3025:267938:270062:+ [translate_table: standard]